MRDLVRCLSLLALCVSWPALAHAQGPPPVADYDPKAWREFQSPEGRFSVLLPGVPVKRVEEMEYPGVKLRSYSFALRTSNQSPQYNLMYVDFPVALDAGDAGAVFDSARDEGMRAVGGKLLEESEDNRLGHPGRFYKVRTGDGGVLRVKAFLVKNRLYNLTFTAEGTNESPATARLQEEAAARFLDSFRLLSAEELSKFEGEVERLLKTLREKKEVVIGFCAEGAECEPLPDVEGISKGNKGSVKGGSVVSKPQPTYPAIAKAARAQGAVVVQVLVDEEGKVMAAQVLSGHPLLQAAAVKAAREALFTPTLLNARPVKVAGTLTYNFVLR